MAERIMGILALSLMSLFATSVLSIGPELEEYAENVRFPERHGDFAQQLELREQLLSRLAAKSGRFKEIENRDSGDRDLDAISRRLFTDERGIGEGNSQLQSAFEERRARIAEEMERFQAERRSYGNKRLEEVISVEN